MHLERWFNVLVLQGALLGGGCDPLPDEPGDDDRPGSSAGESATSEGPGSTGGSATTTTTGDSGAEDQGSDEDTSGSATASSEDSGGTGGSTDGGETASSESTGEPLECSDPANGVDPCGCPCCWIMECINTEACCAGWSECAPS